MRHKVPILAALLVSALPFNPVLGQDGPVYRIPIRGTIEMGLAPYVARSLSEAQKQGARLVVLDLETPGGRVDAALNIVKAISKSTIPVYALVDQHAWSAGAMIALAADSIFMVPGSSIGAATPVVGAKKASEKIVSALRSEFRALAERRQLDPRLAEAMVDEDVEIEGVIARGKLLTLTAGEAVQQTVAARQVESYAQLLESLGAAGVVTVEPGINWAERLVRFLSHPAVAPLLLTIGTLGILIEIKTPTFGLAGLAGVVSLGAFFGSHLIIGLAGWEEVILLTIGMIALLLEVFVVPGFGVAGFISILSIGSAIFLALLGSLPTWADIARASGILVSAAVLIIAIGYAILRAIPPAARRRGIFLGVSTDKAAGYIAAEARDDLVGLEGVAATDLHPSGTAVFETERLDVVCESRFVDKGEAVRIIRSDGYRHVVLPIESDL